MRRSTSRSGPHARPVRLLVLALACASLLVSMFGAGTASGTGWRASDSVAGQQTTAAELRLTLPPPTGPYPVGIRSSFLADPSRIDSTTGKPRTLPIRVWYPAREAEGGPHARYLSPPVQQVVEQAVGVPAGLLDVDTHASSDAPMRRHVRGVILVSPGFGNLVAFSTAQVIDLASRGWVLVTFDHPHDTFVVEQPDGTLVFSDGETEAHVELAFAQRVLDVGVVLRHLSELVPHLEHHGPVGMFGHSLGGAAAAEAMLLNPRLDAGVNLDGTPRGRVVQEGLDEPFGIMVSNVRDVMGIEDINMNTFISHLRGPHPFEQLDIGHNGFTDFAVFNPQATRVDTALGARLEAVIAAGVDSVAAGEAAIAAQRRFLSDFMARYLGRCHERAVGAGRSAVHRARSATEAHSLTGSRCAG